MGSPVSLQLLFPRGGGNAPATGGKDTVTTVSALGPGTSVVRTMAIMPVFTPVVAPVSYRDMEDPTLAGLAAVAMMTRRS